jgi:hypothetical protein
LPKRFEKEKEAAFASSSCFNNKKRQGSKEVAATYRVGAELKEAMRWRVCRPPKNYNTVPGKTQ